MLAPFETLNALLQTRYSCRAFLDRPVAHSDIEKIVEAAQRVPSWCNAQPWQLILCEGAQTKILAAALTAAAKRGCKHQRSPFPKAIAANTNIAAQLVAGNYTRLWGLQKAIAPRRVSKCCKTIASSMRRRWQS